MQGRAIAAEVLGTGVLVATVVGSGIMATNLTDDVAVQLLFNAASTVAALGVLIAVLAPISGADFNPAVTLVAIVRGQTEVRLGLGYMAAQIVGGIAGVGIANLMFERTVWEAATKQRTGVGQWLGEIIATAGLLFVIGALTAQHNSFRAPILIPAWIGAAYLFTSSTSFANPAVTIARAFSDTFSGIAPTNVAAFVMCQLVGAALGATCVAGLYRERAGTTVTQSV